MESTALAYTKDLKKCRWLKPRLVAVVEYLKPDNRKSSSSLKVPELTARRRTLALLPLERDKRIPGGLEVLRRSPDVANCVDDIAPRGDHRRDQSAASTRLARYRALEEFPGLVFGVMTVAYIVLSFAKLAL